MASATQSKKRSKSGRFIKGELNQQKLCAEKLQVVGQQCSQGEKEPANTMSEESECEVSWDDDSHSDRDVNTGFGIVLL